MNKRLFYVIVDNGVSPDWATKTMKEATRDIEQNFLSSKFLPQLIVRSTFHSTKSYKPHSHSQLSLGLIESGETCLTMNGSEHVLTPVSLVLIAPGQVHSCNPVGGKPRSYYMLYVEENWCCSVLSSIYGHKIERFHIEQAIIEESSVGRALIAMIRSLLTNDSQELAGKIESKLYDLISLHCLPLRKPGSDTAMVAEVKNRLLKDLLFPPTVEAIAADLGRSKESVIRSFKRSEGITPKSFLNNYRIEKAKLLLGSGMSIVSVANEVGYSDQSQFHRAFVSYTASTPRQYQTVTFRQ